MKRTKQSKPSSFLVASTMLVVVLASASLARGQDEKPALPLRQQNGEAAAEGQPEEPAARMWTCSMHPQIHLAERGVCPICNMQLIALQDEGADSLMSLDRMLSVALQYNPDIRAARARVIVAEAEFDQTRLQVLQKIIAYRERWQAQHEAVSAATDELQAAQQMTKKGDLPDGQHRQVAVANLVTNARNKLSIVRSRLNELKAEMPLLVGRHDVTGTDASANSSATIIQDSLIPMIEQLVKVTVEDYRSRNAKLTDLQPWSRRLAELKVRTATTNAERVAAVRAHVEWLKTIAEMTKTRYTSGEAQLRDVLAAKIHLSEAELWLTEVGSSAN